MNYYANSEERVGLIAGLRDLADFLDRNSDVPAPLGAVVYVFPNGSNAEMFTGIDVIAAQIGATARTESPRGHYTAVRYFGPVRYCAVAIPKGARDDRESGKAE
jgi:hypothetical protein